MARTVRPMTVRSGTIRHDEEVGFDGRLLEAGPDLVDGDAAISAAWGSTATRTARGHRLQGRVSVSSSGTGQAADATITVTFPGGAFPAAPRVFLRQSSGADLAARVTSVTTTQFVITAGVAPTAGNSYEFEFVVLPG
ncbi:MAG TPA: hypothetical protein VNO79_09120 [Actinomycetota bacterium]|nr:hypothetical protein [Actinomycetota bacterium]